ncbi:hypothetical protein NECAME_11774 [Necator americanus]|uniref:Endonuclease/exonuclease/phosphatase domain-containing protein n=1 Tax=Necator americanus TaxID=51031 RepID=W2T310_NECAM|nr:hypothetical protein NECAME_11774 [Necator americanus]ETN76268.1 hypothetical protein NECAME_11774 [Necator americanus]
MFTDEKMWINTASTIFCGISEVEFDATPALNIFAAYAATSSYEEEVESFYTDLEKFRREDHTYYKVYFTNFNGEKVGLRKTPKELQIETHGLNRMSRKRLSEFIMTTKTTHRISRLPKPPSLRWVQWSPDGRYHSEIDHIIVSGRFCVTDISVVPKFYTRSDHRLL